MTDIKQAQENKCFVLSHFSILSDLQCSCVNSFASESMGGTESGRYEKRCVEPWLLVVASAEDGAQLPPAFCSSTLWCLSTCVNQCSFFGCISIQSKDGVKDFLYTRNRKVRGKGKLLQIFFKLFFYIYASCHEQCWHLDTVILKYKCNFTVSSLSQLFDVPSSETLTCCLGAMQLYQETSNVGSEGNFGSLNLVICYQTVTLYARLSFLECFVSKMKQ